MDDFSIGTDEGVLKFLLPGESTPQPIPLPKAVREAEPGSADLSSSELTTDFVRGSRSFHLIFSQIDFADPPEGPRINRCSIFLFEK